MIIGMGHDVVDIRRIEKILNRFGDRFIKRCFTELEIKKAERRRAGGTHIATYAKRFAAKEACSKALGTGFSQGVYMKDIGIENDDLGRPMVVLQNGALKRLEVLIPEGLKPVIHVTLTDEPPLAMAQIVIEAIQV
jgi:holo-[acyl-carrier protein] synthase